MKLHLSKLSRRALVDDSQSCSLHTCHANQFEFSENEGLPEILINAGFRGICNRSRKFVEKS